MFFYNYFTPKQKHDIPTPTITLFNSTTTLLSTAASIAAGAILFRSIVDDLIPETLYDYFTSSLRNLSNRLSSRLTVVIEESDGLAANHMFVAANTYLGSHLSSSASRIKVNKPPKEDQFSVTIDRNQEMVDYYKGVKFKWVLVSWRKETVSSNKKRSDKGFDAFEAKQFELVFHKKHKEMVLDSYLPYILSKAKAIKEEKKTVKLHTIDYNGTDYWSSINLNHPATFETIAMDPDLKRELMEDLDCFIGRKEYYKRVGKAWKRGYLFHGPPGTGKSSLVAAMANYLKFDIYDLDLGEIQCNSDLRRLLIGTGSKSILVLEDIDCSVELQRKEPLSHGEGESGMENKITLSGLLNFIDGLWSSCGEERIVVCTTNHKERLDPALLRPGRMDVQIHMSYCSFSGFKTLAANYVGTEHHALFEEVEELLKTVEATPAEVAGELMKRKDPVLALEGLIDFLRSKQDRISLDLVGNG